MRLDDKVALVTGGERNRQRYHSGLREEWRQGRHRGPKFDGGAGDRSRD